MCYAFPGPRCTPHAYKQLQTAESMWKDAESNAEKMTAMEIIQAAQLKYDATIGGQRELRERIANGEDTNGMLALRLERGIEDRATSLALIKSEEKGDGRDGEHITHIPGTRNSHIASLNKDPNKDPNLYLDSIAPIEDFRQAAADGRIAVQSHRDPEVPYVTLNYSPMTQIKRDWDEVTMASRGLIIDTTTGEIMARPFKKFFNDNEEAGDLNNFPRTGPVVVSDKMDGSLGVSYPMPDGSYAIATRGSMNSEQAVHATELYARKYAGKWNGEKDEDTTYLFEIIHPQNRIVLDYGDMDDLVLIGAVNKGTGRSVPLDQVTSWPGPRAEIYPYKSYTEALQHQITGDKEGVVIHFTDSDQRVKLKGEEYKRLHKLVTDVTTLRVWENVSKGDPKNFEEWTASMPDEFSIEIKNKANEYRNQYQSIMSGIKSEAARYKKEAKEKGWDRKEMAIQIQKSGHPNRQQIMSVATSDRDQPHWRLERWAWDQIRPHGKELL